MKVLTDRDRALARLLWARGLTIGYIAHELECSVYALSPWLYMEDTPPNRAVRDALHMAAGDDDD